MTKPIYKHPEFVISTADRRVPAQNKRLWLSLRIDERLPESILVILKNPSRATKDISDKTVYNVTQYIYRNRSANNALKNIGNIIILNLIPFYETYSEKLELSNLKLMDAENIDTIRQFSLKHKKVIVAWGNHPKGLSKEYDEIKTEVNFILHENMNEIFYVDKLTKLGNPKHGQIWGYRNSLITLKPPFNHNIRGL